MNAITYGPSDILRRTRSSVSIVAAVGRYDGGNFVFVRRRGRPSASEREAEPNERQSQTSFGEDIADLRIHRLFRPPKNVFGFGFPLKQSGSRRDGAVGLNHRADSSIRHP